MPPTPILNTTGITSSSMRRSMSEAKIVAKPGDDAPNYNTLPNPRLSKTNRYVMFAPGVGVINTHCVHATTCRSVTMFTCRGGNAASEQQLAGPGK